VESDGTFNYDPNGQFEFLAQGETATESFDYTISDGNGGTDTATATVTINGVNDAPEVVNSIPEQEATEDESFNFQLPEDTFTDPDNNLTLSASQGDGSKLPDWLSFDAETGTFSGTPGEDDDGTLQLQVTASDSENETVNSSFILEVAEVNDAPEVANSIADQQATEDQQFNFQVPDNTFTDPDDNNLTLSASQGDGSELPDWLSFDAETGTFSGTPGEDNDGTLELQATATDAAGKTAKNSFTLNIIEVNDEPLANNDRFTTNENQQLIADVFGDNGNGADQDPENDEFSVVAVNDNPSQVGSEIALSSGALLTLNTDGILSYDPNNKFSSLQPGETVTEQFSYTIADGNGGFDTGTVKIAVGEIQNLLILDGSDQQLTVNFNANIQGSSGKETLVVEDGINLSFTPQSDDRVVLSQTLSNSIIKRTGLTELTISDRNGGENITLTVNQNQQFELRFEDGDTTVNLNNSDNITVGNEELSVNEQANPGNINLGDNNSEVASQTQTSLSSNATNLINSSNISEDEAMKLTNEVVFPSENTPTSIEKADSFQGLVSSLTGINEEGTDNLALI